MLKSDKDIRGWRHTWEEDRFIVIAAAGWPELKESFMAGRERLRWRLAHGWASAP